MRVRGGCATWVALLMLVLAPPLAARPESGDGVVRFLYSDPNAQEVYVVGDFNGWSPNATPMDPAGAGAWVAEVFLDPGTYEYKLLVDGAWQLDADNPAVSPAGNSILRVGAGAVVLPPQTSPAQSDPSAAGVVENLRWSVRYLGFVTSERQRQTRRYELVRPEHDIDVGLEARFADDLDGWALTKLRNLEAGEPTDRLSLRFDRAQLLWRPDPVELRMFDNTAATVFDDPATLVGRIGIYEDDFGFRRRGALVRRRVLGAPVEFLYADNSEPAGEAPAAARLVDVFGSAGAPVYLPSRSRRNADTAALRFRGGRQDQGIGVSLRHDRGAYAGQLWDLQASTDSSGPVASGRIFDTTESWSAWGVDLRWKLGSTRIQSQYLAGTRRARAASAFEVSGVRPDSAGVAPVFGSVQTVGDEFDLDRSRRVLVRLDSGNEPALAWSPELGYEYEEHDFSTFVTGAPFVMRRNSLQLGLQPKFAGVEGHVRVEHHWFDYPSGATWQTQFWFRQHNAWLDEDTARYDRLTLLGADQAALLRVELARSLWPARDLRGALRLQYAAPGVDRAPRYVETVLRLALPVDDGLELRTHTRLATLRRVRTQDAGVVAALGTGPHVEAGSLVSGDFADAQHDHRTFASHFVELVYEISSRSDIALGFGVDPWVLYDVRNLYEDIGWDQFLFAEGASPADAFADPEKLGARIEAAERRLERERRLTLEARLRF